MCIKYGQIPLFVSVIKYDLFIYVFQVVKPVNLDALSKWVGHIPEDVIADMAEIAPMLKTMGYDPHGNPPNYGDADKEVIQNTNDIKKNNDDWEKQGEIVKQKSKKLTEA